MKKIIKAAAALLSAVMLMSLAACAGAPEKTQEKSLYDHGLEIISLISEMASSEEYISAYTYSEELREIIAEAAAGDYSKPKAVYRLTGGNISDTLTAEEMGGFELDGLSDALRENLLDRLFSAVPTRVNSQAGSMALAASSICTAGKAFVSSELTENTIYVYTYENAMPVAVNFIMGEDGAVSASGTLLFREGLGDSSIEEAAELLSMLGLTVEEIELK